jgi:hypothetical protein
MERVQAPEQAVPGEEVPSLAPSLPSASAVVPLDKLELLAITARTAPGQEGRDATTALHATLAAFPNTPEHAALLLRLLDEGAFNDVRADDGTPTREVAVEALLNLGYPWALQIQPEELAWYRNVEVVRRRNKWLLLLGVVALGAIAETFLLRLF